MGEKGWSAKEAEPILTRGRNGKRKGGCGSAFHPLLPLQDNTLQAKPSTTPNFELRLKIISLKELNYV
jgi:hypothetical protein